MKKISKYLLSLTFLLAVLYTTAQEPEFKKPLTRILFVFDASQSMAGLWESGKKINIARNLLIDMVDSLQYLEDVELALRIYGHQSRVPPQDCNDTRLEVPFSKNNASKIRQKLRFVNPKGTTPIAHSLELCAKDFPVCSDCRNIIILITDGIEACDGDPCAVSLSLQKKGIVLKPFVIGIGLDLKFKKTFECVGHYFDASNEAKFKEVLGVAISQALNSTTAQVNLLDISGNPTETDVNMTFYDNLSGHIKHNYIHTINNRGNPDTIVLDPLITYSMIAHTLPPVKIDSIQLTPGKHTIVAADAPQGYLILKVTGSNKYRSLNIIVRKAGEMKTLNIQKINETEKYIVGEYDLEVLTLPRIYIQDVEIKQSHTTTISIPTPGIVTLLMSAPGYGSLYVIKDNQLNWIYNINPNITRESLVLQPGTYRVVYRPKNAKGTLYTIDKLFKINPGSSIPINFN